ncbi:hypothetical protein ACFQMH_10180 [Streptomyces viridiviolaceus]|uniref:Uncharacterized protein n=1 Tax=Streptomyces viridiviolaceus TaxID=68282 RepID=A0ABW2DW30_9ACTN
MPQVVVISAWDVPLGGPRALSVGRARTLIGTWSFADHHRPDDFTWTGGMVVAPSVHRPCGSVNSI